MYEGLRMLPSLSNTSTINMKSKLLHAKSNLTTAVEV
jgi:hypothetical protein